MNAKLGAIGIAWATQRPNAIGPRRATNDALLTVSINKAKKNCQFMVSLHNRLLEQSKLKLGDRIDIGVDVEKRHLYIRKSDDGNMLVPPGGMRKSTRASTRFTTWNAWRFKDQRVSVSGCTEVEVADGLIAAKLPDCLFK